jgi:uncharacterized protein (TIGR03086 family)
MEPTDQLSVIIPQLIDLVDRLDPAQLSNRTACTDYDVSGVLDHMMGGAAAFGPAFRGEAPSHPSPMTTPAGEVPAAAFRAAMTGLLAAANSPGAMQRTIAAPFGEVPGSVFARFVAFDGLVHGWDIASAAGLAYDPPNDVVAAADDFARATVGTEMRDGDTFAVETVAPAGATALEQLVAFTGRTL